MDEKKVTIGNVCFIQNHEKGQLLLLKRSREPMQGMYTGVGGKTYFEEDIHTSCDREIQEETGLKVTNLRLKAVIKTILEGRNSSWILFVYTAETNSIQIAICDEGELQWVNKESIENVPCIGFIREILPYVLQENYFLEGTIYHDSQGNVTQKNIKHIQMRYS